MFLFMIQFLILSANAAEFSLQYIGNSISQKEAEDQALCTNKYCVQDAQLLFYAATQNASVDPCVDFKEFSVGTFIKYRALNDRYEGIGLEFDLEKQTNERFRKLLVSVIDEKNDIRVFKVMKNFFRKCVDSSKFFRLKVDFDFVYFLQLCFKASKYLCQEMLLKTAELR